MPRFNGGIYYLEPGPTCTAVYEAARQLLPRYDELGFVRLRGSENDEVLMASALAIHGIAPLVEDGLIDTVIRQLMSGKEAMIFVVRCGDAIRCAKVYKEANKRSFRQAVAYTEGRKTKNSRRARAMEKGTRYGRKVQEEAWQSAEVDALYRLDRKSVV